MKKIMFSDKFGLTKAVLNGTKTQTRRFIKGNSFIARYWNPCLEMPHCYYKDERGMCQVIRPNGELIIPIYKIGEKVAIAQRHIDIVEPRDEAEEVLDLYKFGETLLSGEEVRAGWNNKMFVRADLMPHHIEITKIRLEKLQDISYEDCIEEGIIEDTFNDGEFGGTGTENYTSYYYGDRNSCNTFSSPREAYAALIDKVGKKGDWESNPYVFVYEFKLVD